MLLFIFSHIIQIWTITINSDTHMGELELHFILSLSSCSFVLALFLPANESKYFGTSLGGEGC